MVSAGFRSFLVTVSTSLVALDRWPSYTVTILWEFACEKLALSSYRGGRLNRFDYFISIKIHFCLYLSIIICLLAFLPIINIKVY